MTDIIQSFSDRNQRHQINRGDYAKELAERYPNIDAGYVMQNNVPTAALEREKLEAEKRLTTLAGATNLRNAALNAMPKVEPVVEGEAVAADPNDIFDPNAEIQEDALYTKTPQGQDFAAASRVIYNKMFGQDSGSGFVYRGMALPMFSDREVPETDEDFARFGVEFMGQFNYNITKMGIDVAKLQGLDENTALAFYSAMTMYDRLPDFTWNGTKRMTQGIASDPTTIAGLGTLGWAFLGRSASKQTTKTAFKEYLKSALASSTAVGAIEGGVYGGLDNYFRQQVAVDAEIQDGINLSELGTAATVGTLAGGVLGKTTDVIGDAVSKAVPFAQDVARNVGEELQTGAMYSNPAGVLVNALTKTIAKPGQQIPQSAPAPSLQAVQEAQADTRQAASIVGERLPVIVPEAERVNGGAYTSGAPNGGAWTDLPPADLAARGGGLQATDADLEGLWQQTLSEVSQAGRDAVTRSGATWSAFSAAMWDKALRLPARSQLWYELSGEAFVRRLPDLNLQEHMMFLDLIGATSARAEPGVNLERSLAVLSQELRGVPIDVDLTITSTVEDALQRQGDGVSSDLANKTGMFSDTLALTAGLPVQYPISVNDVWVGKAFGVSDSELSANQALHEVFGKYMNKLRETVNTEGNSAIPHESWHLQARQWVEMRSTDKGIDTSSPNLSVEGNDYAGEFKGVVEKLEAAGIQVPGGIITKDILMNPGFADALRATTPAFRNAPKATVEFGTLLTPAGEEGAALYQRARESGDKLTQQEYLSTLTSSMFHSGRGKSTIWEETVRLATNKSDKVTRIVSPTSDDPFAISGTFEGAAAPNIRVPLKDMSPDQIAYFNAMAGQGLKQKAMAAAEIKPLRIDAALPEGYVETYSMLFNWTDKVPEEMLTGIANALGEGFEISVAKYPNGLKVDVNPRFGDAGPEGPDADAIDAVADYLESTYNVEGLEQFRAAFKSEYGKNYVEDDGTGAAYLEIIENTLKGWNDEGTNQVIELGVPEAVARQFINGDIDAIPKLDGKTPAQTVSIKGKARTVRKRLLARVNTHNEKLAAWQELGNGLDAKMQSQLAKWTKRLDTSAKKAATVKTSEAPTPEAQAAYDSVQTPTMQYGEEAATSALQSSVDRLKEKAASNKGGSN